MLDDKKKDFNEIDAFIALLRDHKKDAGLVAWLIYLYVIPQ